MFISGNRIRSRSSECICICIYLGVIIYENIVLLHMSIIYICLIYKYDNDYI